MPEEKTKSFAEDLLKGMGRSSRAPAEEEEGRSRERQMNAFSLNWRHKDGRTKPGISWGQYVTHEFHDDGEKEVIDIIMGMQVVTLEGYNLEVLLPDIESGQLKRVKERNSREVEALRRSNPNNEEIIARIEVVPDVQEMKLRLVEEAKHESGFAGKPTGRGAKGDHSPG